MRVTYLNHSGFLLEWKHCYWLFDYYKGQLPALDSGKSLFVFCSHSHGDHFNPDVFALAKQYPAVTYVFANQVRQAYRKLGKSEKELPEVIFLQNRTDTELSDGYGDSIHVHTLQSTDCGCAFFLTYQDRTVYHAGDLHWWTWPGESEAENRKMAGDYKKEIGYLAGRQVDFAFTPLDPRQGKDYGLGISYLLEKVSVRNVFPMHFWDDFTVIDRYLSEYAVPERTTFHRIVKDGQSWEFE